jgi:cysteine desulfuration protein SufE
MNIKTIPARLAEIIEDFELSEGREKIEMLVDYSERMSPLPEQIAQNRNTMEEVPECMTPVFIAAKTVDGGMHFYFDVPPESPTVRGFASILSQGLDGASPEQVLEVPNDFFYRMGLEQVLTMQRLKGFSSILAHMKRLATEVLGQTRL